MGSLACRAGDIKILLQNATYGLEALKNLITGLNNLALTDILSDKTAFNGADVASIKALLEDGTSGLSAIEKMLQGIEGSGFDTATDSLKVISDVLDEIKLKAKKYAWKDHDTAYIDVSSPTKDQWYEVFHDQNVRLLWCVVKHYSNEGLSKEIKVKWTIDGDVYLMDSSLVDATNYVVFRYFEASLGGTDGLFRAEYSDYPYYAMDKRGLDFKVEIAIASTPGTDQHILAWCPYETLEETT